MSGFIQTKLYLKYFSALSTPPPVAKIFSFTEFLIQYYFLNTARQSRIIGRWINLDKKNKNNYYSQYLNVTIKRLKKSLYNLQNEKLSKLYSKVIS